MKKKVTKLSREAHDSLKRQWERFIEEFGQQPGPGDPLFFDPDYDVPTPSDGVEAEKSIVGSCP